jgi:hypothetical protein
MSQAGNAAGLWNEALSAFEGHRIPRIDVSAQAALNRIAAKCLGISFDSTNCDIREETLDLAALGRLIVFHDRASPKRDEEPIIILSFDEDDRYVIDGANRVNKWRTAGEPQSRRAIVIEPKTDAG